MVLVADWGVLEELLQTVNGLRIACGGGVESNPKKEWILADPLERKNEEGPNVEASDLVVFQRFLAGLDGLWQKASLWGVGHLNESSELLALAAKLVDL